MPAAASPADHWGIADVYLTATMNSERCIERILPLSRAAEAHRLIESGQSQGKIVLDPTLG